MKNYLKDITLRLALFVVGIIRLLFCDYKIIGSVVSNLLVLNFVDYNLFHTSNLYKVCLIMLVCVINTLIYCIPKKIFIKMLKWSFVFYLLYCVFWSIYNYLVYFKLMLANTISIENQMQATGISQSNEKV